MKYCSNCGNKLEENDSFCSNCGNEINNCKIKKLEGKRDFTQNGRKKHYFSDILRYFFGCFFFLGGIYNLNQGKWYCIFNFLFALSWFPFIYRQLLNKYINNKKYLNLLQIILPILMFIILIVILPNNDSSVNSSSVNETEEEKILTTMEEKLYSSYQTIINSKMNSETRNYDFKISEKNSNISAYECARDAQYLAKKLVGYDKIGNIEFECENNGKIFYYVVIENVGSIALDSINDNTKYYDSNYNIVNTNIDLLKENEINDYKKSCVTYEYKEVLRYPSIYKGKNAYWFGKIVQVVDKTFYSSIFRINVTCEKYSYTDEYFCDDAIYVTYFGDQSFIVDDMVKMWGSMDGTQTYTTVLGASVTIPKFDAQYIELQ